MADEGVSPKQDAEDVIKNGISLGKNLQNRDSSKLSSQLDLDPYDEDQAELQFLESKPTCFVVLGKPGVGKTLIASKLAEDWKCQFINANQLITEAISSQTELGKRTEEILLRGESVPEELAVKLLEEKIYSPEVAHHGYVLDDFPCLSEEFLTIRQQLDFINSWPLKPDFILHLKIPDMDLETRRIGQKVDPITGDLYTKDVYDPEKTKKEVKGKGEDEEEEDEEEDEQMDEDEEEDSNKLAPEIVDRLILRPEDMPSHVGCNIQQYKSSMLRLLEEYMADHNQQFLIELDANKPVDVLIKETLVRLSCFRATPAAIPIRLNEGEAEEDLVPDDTDTDELFRSLSGKQAPSSRFRWRRSRWQRCCPVALAQGDLIPGRAELAVAFLDKIYFLSSEEALSAFLKNPRPYLLPPQPRPPCKLIVTGPPLSGKTTLCNLLANRYGAQVLNIKGRMGPKLVEERERKRIQLMEEVTQSSIEIVRAKLEEEARRKIKEEQEEQQRKLEEEAKLKVEEDAEEEEEEEEEMEEKEKAKPAEGDDSESEEKETKDNVEEETTVSSSVEGKLEVGSEEGLVTTRSEDNSKTDDKTIETDVPETEREEPSDVSPVAAAPEVPLIEVTADHPDVMRAVEEALNAAKLDEFQLPLDAWMEVLEEAIEEVEKEMRKKNPTGPLHGGWILDNFPETKEQWSMLFERNVILPDCIVVLQDNSPNGELLIKRWYMMEKDAIDRQISERLEKEKDEHREQEEEKQRLIEEQKAEDVRIKAEQESQQHLESEDLEEEKEGDEEREIPHESGEKLPKSEADEEERGAAELQSTSSPEVPVSNYEISAEEGAGVDGREKPSEVNLDQSPTEGPVESPTEGPAEGPAEGPLEGLEVAARRELMKKYDADWTNIASIITGNSALEPFSVAISATSKADVSEDGDASEAGPVLERSESEISNEVVKYMEKIFVYQGWERTPNDIDEEEGGDMAAEEEEEEEEHEEEEESDDFDPNRSMKKPLGETSFYCPVVLKEKGVLWPGDPDCGAKYREKIYYLSDADARDRFLADPLIYLPKDGPFVPPPLRILLLGPRGAGKTTHGRHLARKLGLFHIQFRERLQELVVAKMKKKVVPEREEEPEEVLPTDIEPEELVASAVDGPKGTTLNKTADSFTEEADPSTHLTASAGLVASASNPDTPSVVAKGNSAEQELLDEVPATQLTDEEEAIVSYLRDDEPLPADFLLKLLEEWWHQEPFRSTGLILEGFPSTADEVNILGEHGLYPDAAIILTVEDVDVLARLLPPKMDRWRQRRDRKLAHKQQVKDRKREKREREMRMRKEELMNEAEARKQERLAEKQKAQEDGDGSDDEEDDVEDDDIEGKIAEEFEEEEEEEEEEETEEDASDRMKNEFMEIYETDTSKISIITEKLADLMIPRIEIDSGRRQPIVRYTFTKKLKPLVEHRMSMFERVFPISERLAQKMLQVGYKQKSRFGQWCPVKLSEGDYQQPKHGAGFNSYPAIHRAYIYFLSSQQAREEFMRDPLTFLCQPSPKPVVPVRMAIIGPPKSGKTTLAKRFADDFGLVRLSVGEAIRNVLANQPKTELAQCIQLYLYQGLTVPDECAIQALDVALMDVQCQTRGYILDGYPLKKIQVDFMEGRNIIPVKVIEIQVDSKELANRATKDRYSPDRVLPLHDSAQIFAVKLSAWQTEIGAVRAWYQNQHDNWVALPGERSKWWIWNSSKEIARNSVVQIQTYLQRIAEGKAASVADMCITPTEFAARLGDFGQYCPVSLALRGELCDCSMEPTLKYAVEFRGHYYKMAGPEELAIFLNDPEKFLPPSAPRTLPSSDLLPKRRTGTEARQMFPKAIELQGYCPVTFLDGKQRYEAIVPGDPELVVEYHDKLFCMETEEKLHKFMRLPEKYWNLKLPHKLPPRKEPLKVNGLPMLGYLEQTVAQVVTKAMTAVGNFKPKYPFMSATQSALVYFALQLKAMNPNSTEYVRKKYKRKLLQYEETCELISYLGNNMTRRYKEPKDRPIDFDFKLEKFMQLQMNKVNPEMWVS